MNFDDLAATNYFGKTGEIFIGHPLTVDIETPGYVLVNAAGFGSFQTPADIQANTYQTRPFSVIYDSGNISFVSETPQNISYNLDTVFSGKFDSNTGIIATSANQRSTQTYTSFAVNDPFKASLPNPNITYPSGKMKYLSNGKFQFCVNIPNIFDYINDGNISTFDSDKTQNIRRLLLKNSLRMFVFTDTMPKVDDQMTPSKSPISLKFGCSGNNCGDPNSTNTECDLCNTIITNPRCYVVGQITGRLSGDGRTFDDPRCSSGRRSINCFPNCGGSSCIPCCNVPGRVIEYTIICDCAEGPGCGCRGSYPKYQSAVCPPGTANCYGDTGQLDLEIVRMIQQAGGSVSGSGTNAKFFIPVDLSSNYNGGIWSFIKLDIVNPDVLCGSGTVTSTCSCPTVECVENCYNYCVGGTTSYQNQACKQAVIDNNRWSSTFIEDIKAEINNTDISYIRTKNDFTLTCTNSSFTGFTGKKIFINEVDFICVPVADIDPGLLGTLQDCELT